MNDSNWFFLSSYRFQLSWSTHGIEEGCLQCFVSFSRRIVLIKVSFRSSESNKRTLLIISWLEYNVKRWELYVDVSISVYFRKRTLGSELLKKSICTLFKCWFDRSLHWSLIEVLDLNVVVLVVSNEIHFLIISWWDWSWSIILSLWSHSILSWIKSYNSFIFIRIWTTALFRRFHLQLFTELTERVIHFLQGDLDIRRSSHQLFLFHSFLLIKREYLIKGLRSTIHYDYYNQSSPY